MASSAPFLATKQGASQSLNCQPHVVCSIGPRSLRSEHLVLVMLNLNILDCSMTLMQYHRFCLDCKSSRHLIHCPPRTKLRLDSATLCDCVIDLGCFGPKRKPRTQRRKAEQTQKTTTTMDDTRPGEVESTEGQVQAQAQHRKKPPCNHRARELVGFPSFSRSRTALLHTGPTSLPVVTRTIATSTKRFHFVVVSVHPDYPHIDTPFQRFAF